MTKTHTEILNKLRREIESERVEEIEYGMKEFIQGVLIGFIIGFIIASQLVV